MNRSNEQAARDQLGLWDAHFEVFKTMTPPLRPHETEVAIMQELVTAQGRAAPQGRIDALILGLTPELVGMDWPANSRVVVADRSQHVVEQWWPGDIPGRRELVLADWLDLPFGTGEFDLILGDGVFNFMPYPQGFRDFAASLSRLLRPGGRLGVRIFALPVPPEAPDQLVKEYHRSQTIDYFGFRFRLAQSIQQSPERGLVLNKDTVDDFLTSRGVVLQELYDKSGHTPPPVPRVPANTVQNYRVHYSTEEQFVEQFGRYFEVLERRCGEHPLAGRTPIFMAAPL